MLYAEGEGAPASGFDRDYAPRTFGLGRLTLYGDGTFDVETLGEVPVTAILDPQGRRLNSYSVPGMVLSDGALGCQQRAIECALIGVGQRGNGRKQDVADDD